MSDAIAKDNSQASPSALSGIHRKEAETMKHYSENLMKAVNALRDYLNDGSDSAGHYALTLYGEHLTSEERAEYDRVKSEILADLPF